MSPYSYFAASRDPSKQRKSIRCSLAGSVCIDYSLIGALALVGYNDVTYIKNSLQVGNNNMP